ncbi:anthranilate synthase, component II [Tistlia consotensis]|uniref:Anthranilate synthase, component II n=1 Tax=Tistlia consotensis USBA 355 TaxID=560819 RepID=A0A1Y6CJV7_9PROT|nr:aminodeoxychorismate/anthranilate synthase component II [Tistlia consotensis]SMF69884.1 anthranilate synthase, component II [Tistlia consotensis USBA 355]SNS05182.1 anthranilate synthase, component II [Tistlia consotensis]
MFLLIDNYDSFTYNLFHFLGELGAELEVRRNDALTADEALALKPQGIILSPGPCDPPKAGICLELIAKAAGKLPLLGVCLGHQAIGEAFGGRVVRGPAPMHGKVTQVVHQGRGVFAGLPSPFAATRYHSLVVAREGLPDCLEITAEAESEGGGDGVIMGLQHRELPIHGVQFHPESIASEHGHRLLGNFLRLAGMNDIRPLPAAAAATAA